MDSDGNQLCLTFRHCDEPPTALHRVDLTWDSSPNDLKRIMGATLGIPPERLILSCYPDPFSREDRIAILRGKDPFSRSTLKNGDPITYALGPIPEDFDIIGECDGCGDIAHLFYGYSCSRGNWEPVVAHCVTCGGRKSAPWESDSD